ncbi:MAG: heavy metal-binding domain-containing protein [Thermoplasmata archaeon]
MRSRGIGGNIVAGLRTIPGGEITEYTQMLDQARYEALARLMQHAKSLGANAVISARFDSSEIDQTMSEILAYGTAVVIAKDDSQTQPVSLK